MTPLKLRTIKREELGRREMISHRIGEDTCNTLKKSNSIEKWLKGLKKHFTK